MPQTEKAWFALKPRKGHEETIRGTASIKQVMMETLAAMSSRRRYSGMYRRWYLLRADAKCVEHLLALLLGIAAVSLSLLQRSRPSKPKVCLSLWVYSD